MNTIIQRTLIAALFFTSCISEAIEVGGLNLGLGPKLTLNANKADVGSSASRTGFGYSWGLGGTALLSFESFALELGLNYSERRMSIKNLLGITGDYAITLRQFEMPLLGYYRHELSESLAMRAGAGLQLELAMGDIKGDAGTVSYGLAGVSTFGTSLLLGIGTDHKLSEQNTLIFDLRCALGLNDRSKSTGLLFTDKFKTQYIELGGGLLF